MMNGVENNIVMLSHFRSMEPEFLERYGYRGYFRFKEGEFFREALSQAGDEPYGGLVVRIIAPELNPSQRIAFVTGWERARLEALRRYHLNRADKYLRRAFFFSFLSVFFAILAIVITMIL